MTSIKQSVVWISISAVGRQLIQFGSLMILSRTMAPEAFGLAAIVTAITTFISVFLEAGLVAAVVQPKALNSKYAATAFAVNMSSSLLLGASLAALALPIAHLYGYPALSSMVLVAAVGVLLSVQFVPEAMLIRRMHFKMIALVEVASAVAGQFVAVLLALSTTSPLALVVGPVVTTFVTVVGLWSSAKWLPRTYPDLASLRAIWKFCKYVVLFNAVNYWARNLDVVLLGRTVSAQDLAFYSRAYQLMLLPVQQLANVVARVYLPVLSQNQDDPVATSAHWGRGARASWILGLFATAVVVICGTPLVVLLFGSEWAPVGSILAIFAWSIPPQMVSRTTGSLYQALDQTKRAAAVGFVNTAIMIAAVLTGLHWGVTGVAIASAVALWVHFGILLWDIHRWAFPVINILLSLLQSALALIPALSLGLVVLQATQQHNTFLQTLSSGIVTSAILAATLAIIDKQARGTIHNKLRRASRKRSSQVADGPL